MINVEDRLDHNQCMHKMAEIYKAVSKSSVTLKSKRMLKQPFCSWMWSLQL